MEAKIYCIRHAQSAYNSALEAWLKSGGLEAELKVSPLYPDPDLTDLGFQQVQLARSHVHSLPIDKVYVSPLRRSLLTGKGLFEHHPMNPSIVVIPDITEQLFSSCDLSKSPSGLDPQFPEFDWSAFRTGTDSWLFDLIDNEITQVIRTNYRPEQWNDIACFFLGGSGIESLQELERRCAKVRDMLKTDVRNGLTVAIVSHWCFIKQLTLQADESFSNLPNAGVQDITSIVFNL